MITEDTTATAALYFELLLGGDIRQSTDGSLRLNSKKAQSLLDRHALSLAMLENAKQSIQRRQNLDVTNLPTQSHLIDKREVIVVDNVLNTSELGDFFCEVQQKPYRPFEYDFADDVYPIFSTEVPLPEFYSQAILASRVVSLLCTHFDNESHRLTRAYVNLCRYGDMEYPHKDCDSHEKNITALYYANETWDQSFGGETKFYQQDQSTALAVLPKPGRLVLFRGAITHIGSVPTRICTLPRYTLALKFKHSPLSRLK